MRWAIDHGAARGWARRSIKSFQKRERPREGARERERENEETGGVAWLGWKILVVETRLTMSPLVFVAIPNRRSRWITGRSLLLLRPEQIQPDPGVRRDQFLLSEILLSPFVSRVETKILLERSEEEASKGQKEEEKKEKEKKRNDRRSLDQRVHVLAWSVRPPPIDLARAWRERGTRDFGGIPNGGYTHRGRWSGA